MRLIWLTEVSVKLYAGLFFLLGRRVASSLSSSHTSWSLPEARCLPCLRGTLALVSNFLHAQVGVTRLVGAPLL